MLIMKKAYMQKTGTLYPITKIGTVSKNKLKKRRRYEQINIVNW